MAAVAFRSVEKRRPLAARFAGSGALRWITGIASWALEEWRLRREIRVVEALGDAELRDMGVARGAIEEAVRHGRRPPR